MGVAEGTQLLGLRISFMLVPLNKLEKNFTYIVACILFWNATCLT